MENNCQNCSSDIDSKYKFCPNCGQKMDIHRLNFHFIWHEIVHAFIHADKSIFNLTKQMATQPGVVVKNYVEGKRKRYFNPFSYFLISAGIMALLTSAFHILEVPNVGKAPDFMTTHFNKLIFLSIPFLSFFTWLFFRKSGYNYWENFIFHIFLGGFRVVYFLLFVICVMLFRQHYYIFLSAFVLAGLIYNIHASKQFYGENWLPTIIKCFFTTFLTQIVLSGVLYSSIQLLK
jgi:hypothetical protein